jgi:hypothetical protein
MYKINFESNETFLNHLKDVEDNENNKLWVYSDIDFKEKVSLKPWLKTIENFQDNCINNLKFIVYELLKFKKIKLFLFLNYYDLTKIPKIIYSLENLIELCLISNDIDHISFNICKLQKLKKLWISNNNFIKFPLILYDLQNLQVIYIFGYKNDLKQKRLLFRLYFVICKSYILKKFFIYKILEKLIKF